MKEILLSFSSLPVKSGRDNVENFANLEDLVFVRLEGVELELQVSEVPESDRLVGRAGGEDELGGGVEGQTVDFRRVSVDLK